MTDPHHATLPRYSIVIPVFNEERGLPELFQQLRTLMDSLDGTCETILVDDGSRDNSHALMLAIHRKDPRFTIVQLSRNYGHQIAITAGMDVAQGDATIIMDADLQDPPQVIHEMITKWKDGFEIVYGIRENREGESWFKRGSAALFYRILNRLTDIEIPKDVGDFRLVDRKALDAFKLLRERHRYVRGLFTWIGFKQTGVYYVRHCRKSGVTKYSMKKMLRLAEDALMSFSDAPVRLMVYTGGLFFLASIASSIFTLITATSAWIPIALFLSSVQLSALAIIGNYLSRIYDELKARPLYLLHSLNGTWVEQKTERPPLQAVPSPSAQWSPQWQEKRLPQGKAR